MSDDAGGRFTIDNNGQITVADGSLLDFEANASHSVTVTVTDAAGLTYTEAFTINLGDVNEAPVATDSLASMESGETIKGQLTGSDPDAGDGLTYSLANAPANGTVTINSDGSYSFVPDASYSEIGRAHV